MEQLQLFSDEEMLSEKKLKKRKGRQKTLEDYDSFVKKFDLNRAKTRTIAIRHQPFMKRCWIGSRARWT